MERFKFHLHQSYSYYEHYNHIAELTVENCTGASIKKVLCSKVDKGVFWDGGDSERNDLVDRARCSRAAAPDRFRISPLTFWNHEIKKVQVRFERLLNDSVKCWVHNFGSLCMVLANSCNKLYLCWLLLSTCKR